MAEAAPPLLDRIASHAGRTAIMDAAGEHGYDDLAAAAGGVAARLREAAGAEDLDGARVALLAEPGFGWAAGLLGAWRAGAMAVPLCLSHPDPEIERVLDDAGVSAALAGSGRAERLAPLAAARGIGLHRLEEIPAAADDPGPAPDPDRDAMILYTSGTTGGPKGVVLSHANLAAQAGILVEAWGWTPDDRLLHCLPLHHTHGIVNGLLSALAAGATCDMLPGFDAGAVWRAFVERPITLFMAVPTVYVRLIAEWEAAGPSEREIRSRAAGAQRVMISGSAALPVPVFERWREIAGQTLLERYGMTEIGMALSNPLHGERRPGSVGRPLPGVSVRLVDDAGEPVEEPGVPGEIEVAGPTVFARYWERPEATGAAFREGWFRTGDEAIVEDGAWRIRGRRSVDIVKTGGEKVSALEVEGVLLAHPAVAECAVVGAPDPEWGERVSAAVVPAAGQRPTLEALRAFARERIAPYKAPTRLVLVERLPRNAMGKVVKPAVQALFESNASAEPVPEHQEER